MIINNVKYNLDTIDDEFFKQCKHNCLQSFPVDKSYNVIYADPPWMYNSNKVTNDCSKHYPVMSLDSLKQLPVNTISAKDCALFLWTTNPMLESAFELIQAWGFSYKTIFKVWRKVYSDGTNVQCPGWWSRGSTELLLVSTRGSPLKYKASNHTELQEFTSIRTIHSEKPHSIRESIENFLSVDSKIELFARHICDGWDAWGLEVPGYFHESINDILIHDTNKRSIGIQVDMPNKKTTSQSNKRKPNGHKEDCKCCVCKHFNKS